MMERGGAAAAPIRHRLTFRSEYPDVDSMGFVYYGVYADWFTRGRIELLRAWGLRYAALEQEGLFLPVLKLECTYRAPVRLDDQVELMTEVALCTRTRLSFVYHVRRIEEEHNGGQRVLCATGRTDHAFIDERRRPIDVAKRFPHVWDVLSAWSHKDGMTS